MFSHVMIGTNDMAASKKFYDAVLGVLGLPEGRTDPKGRVFYRSKTGVFGITKPIDGDVDHFSVQNDAPAVCRVIVRSCSLPSSVNSQPEG